MTKLKRILTFISSRIGAFKKSFDIRDVFVFSGLGMMGYGLWLLRPWIGFAVSGAVLMIIGYLMRGK